MDLDLKGRKALVTGASRGIGLAIAKSLAAEGARVALVSRGAATLKSALASLGRTKGHAAKAIDLADASGVKTLCAWLKAGFGSPGIVVHNAGGTLDVREPLCPIEDWRRILRLNLEAAIEINNALIPEMKRSGWGRIVHISSVSGAENLGPAPYCVAKAALNAYARSYGRLFAADGIVISAVAPGAVYSPGGPWDKAARERPEHVERYLRERTPMHRFSAPEEIAAVVTFLCSARASQCTGAVVPVDGGLGKAFAA